jgi:hypothetical protein
MRNFRSVVAALVVATFTTSALAQPAPGTPAGESDKPWAKGVSADDQKEANALFKEGNALMRDSFFVQAVEKYRAAVGHWDHPAIHYNLAIALINLDQPLEVYASLEKALAYGDAALDEEKRELAERYMKLVSQQLSVVTVTCDVPDAKVYIDGKEAFTGPGKVERRVRAGEHTFTATKSGFETASMTKILPGGQPAQVPLKLYRPEELTRYKRHFAPWLPWAVTGAGVAIAGIGAAVHSSARSDFTAFDQWAADCEEDSGMACTVTDEAQSLRDGGDTKQSIAVGMYVAGAATVVAGLTMVLINRPQPYRVDSESPEPKGVVVVPAIGDGQVGVSASLRF